MSSIGNGVFELKDLDQNAWYRVVYIARKNDVIYVLDCFEKHSRKTEKRDRDRAKGRYKVVQQRLREEQKNAKRT